jgi:FkbM family methyltransferase
MVTRPTEADDLPLFLHVHHAPGISDAEVRAAHLLDTSLGKRHRVDYQRYWVDPAAGKFFCLVEAPDAQSAVMVHAEGHGMIPAEVYTVREGLRDRRDYDSMRVLFAGALAPDSNCVDVGCSLGVVLRAMLQCAPGGQHIAYEPSPALYADLINQFPAVDIRNAALSDQPGEREFVHMPNHIGYSHFLRGYESREQLPGELITVRAETLDTALPDGYVPALIKIDVEGAELEVLKGGEQTLAAFRPIVIFEHGLGRPDVSEELFDLLSDRAGLRIYDIDGDGPLKRQTFLNAINRGRIWNFVARA